MRAVRRRHADLQERHPEPFENADIAQAQRQLLEACEAALLELQSPVLRISLMGTTSSGKSTLANGLIGRRVAPIEAQEMSAGVLRFASGDSRSVTCRGAVDESLNGQWDSGIDDVSVYERIQQVLVDFHRERKLREVPTPWIDVTGETLPTADPSLLGLPAGVGVELIDLPGLRAVDDADNLRVIQSTVSRSVSLVTLDYGQIDDRHRAALLAELRQVVGALGGRTDLMVFVLNRVDQRSGDDLPLEQRLEALSKEIQRVLDLEEPAVVIPLSARLLYRSQAVWGPAALDAAPATDAAARQEALRLLMEDCGHDLVRLSRGNPGFKALFRRLEDDLDAGREPSIEDVRQLLRTTIDASHGRRLWDAFRQRVARSFPEVVLLPAVSEVLETHGALLRQLRSWARAQDNKTVEEVASACDRLEAERDRVQQTLRGAKQHWDQRLTDAGELLNSDAYKDTAQAREMLGALADLSDSVTIVKGGLEQGYLTEITQDLGGRRTRMEFLEAYGRIEGFPQREVARLYDAFDNWWLSLEEAQRLGVLNADSDRLVLEARADYERSVRAIDGVERSLRQLQQVLLRPLRLNARFLLQAQARSLRLAGAQLLQEQQRNAYETLERADLVPEVREELRAGLELYTSPDSIPAPAAASWDLGVEREAPRRSEQTGTRTVEKKKRVFFFFTRTVRREVPVFEDVEYVRLSLPGPQTLVRESGAAVDAMAAEMRAALVHWVRDLLTEAVKEFGAHIDRVVDLALGFLAEQRTRIEERGELRKEHLKAIGDDRDHAAEAGDRLRGLATGRGVTHDAD